jgi:hypothetical protein
MTTITVFEESGRSAPIEAIDDPALIKERLGAIGAIGAGFRRLDAARSLPPDADEAFENPVAEVDVTTFRVPR